MAPTCTACQTIIADRYFLKTDGEYWHVDCLRCTSCGKSLEDAEKCFLRDSEVYCQDDYTRLYRQRCSRCYGRLAQNEMVMKVQDRVYHIPCFTCGICGRILNPGEHFSLNGNILHCQDELTREDEILPTYPLSFNFPIKKLYCAGHHNLIDSLLTKARGRRIRAAENHLHISDYSLLPLNKQKRLRTSFKHHQVRIMRTYFSLNHNPDAKDLKTLSEKTGLSKRVLQVWFQNARAKHRRSGLSKSDTNSHSNDEIVECSSLRSEDTLQNELSQKDGEIETGIYPGERSE